MISGWFVFYAECGLASLGERLSGRLERILSGWVEEVSRFLGFLHTASHSTAIIAYLPSVQNLAAEEELPNQVFT